MARIHPPGTPRVPSKGRQAAAVIQEPDEANTQENEAAEAPRVNQEVVDPTIALKEQIAALEKSNREFQARVENERLETQRRAQEREAEFSRLQEQTVTSQQEAIDAALAAANTEAETAQSQIETALSMGDGKAMAEAQRRLSRSEARILALENGKEALEREIKERPKPVEVKPQPADPLDNVQIPQLAKQWLRAHPEYLNDGRKNAKLQALHWDVVDEGYEAYSQDYFERVEQRLGMRPDPHIEEEEVNEPAPPVKRPVVSAPPSREVPETGTGRTPRKVTLSPAEKEAARISGISEEVYAAQKLKLLQEKQNGNYGGAP